MFRFSRPIALALLACLLGLVSLLSCCLGNNSWTNPFLIFQGLAHTVPNEAVDLPLKIVVQLRLPRLLIGIMAGVNLSLAGLIMQTLFRNPLADPYIIGISSGAALGAVATIASGFDVVLGMNAVALFSFLGAMLVVVLVYGSTFRIQSKPTNVLLNGVAIGALAQAATTLILMQREGSEIRVALSWLLGSLAYRDWNHVRFLLPYTLLGVLLLLFYRKELDLLSMDDDSAHHLGVNVVRSRFVLMATASLLAASTVSVCGIIGFVGMIVPNTMRKLFGPAHSALVPACVLGGGGLLTGSDLLARACFPANEIPAGVITSLVGGIFFACLLRRRPSHPSDSF